MDQLIWTTPLKLENQAGRRAHNRAAETEERAVRRRTRMNSSPQQPYIETSAMSSSHRPRRRLLSAGDVFENMRGGPSKAYREYRAEVMTEKEKNAALAEVARQGPPPGGKNEGQREDASKGKETPSLRGLLRRASIGMRERRQQHTRRPSQSRSSQSAEEPAESYVSSRPSTSASTWHKLKNAASFTSTSYTIEEKSPALDKAFDHEYKPTVSTYATRLSNSHDIQTGQGDDQDLPQPGRGALPPYIPERSGGEAARATAAAQNEVLAQVRRMTLVENRDSSMEWESGVDMASLSHVDSHSNPRDSASSGASGNRSRFKVERIDFTSSLPYEISAHIFGLLDASTLTRCELVSKRWHNIVATPAIWQTSLFREQSKAFSLGRNIRPDEGLGLPKMNTHQDWKSLYEARVEVEKNWKVGHCKSTYLCGHTDSVYCLQFDEHKIVTGSRDRTIRIWDLHTYECLAIIASPAFQRHPKGIDNWNMTTAHHRAPAPTSSDDAPHSITKVSNTVPALYKHPIHHAASILCLQYDSEILVTGSSDTTVIVHSMKPPYTPLFRLKHHRQAVLDVAFDNTHIVTASKDNSIGVYSRTTGQLLNILRGHSAPVNSVQINGSSIVSCSGDFSVKLWSLESGTCIREFEGHTKGLACSQFSADGKYIASAGNDKIIRVWDAHTGACIKSVPAHEGLIRTLFWDNVSGRLISGSYDHDILVWDLKGEGEEKGVKGDGKEGSDIKCESEWKGWHGSWVLSAKGDWRRMVSAGQDRRILVCDFGEGVGGVERLESVGVNADGEMCQGEKN